MGSSNAKHFNSQNSLARRRAKSNFTQSKFENDKKATGSVSRFDTSQEKGSSDANGNDLFNFSE